MQRQHQHDDQLKQRFDDVMIYIRSFASGQNELYRELSHHIGHSNRPYYIKHHKLELKHQLKKQTLIWKFLLCRTIEDTINNTTKNLNPSDFDDEKLFDILEEKFNKAYAESSKYCYYIYKKIVGEAKYSPEIIKRIEISLNKIIKNYLKKWLTKNFWSTKEMENFKNEANKLRLKKENHSTKKIILSLENLRNMITEKKDKIQKKINQFDEIYTQRINTLKLEHRPCMNGTQALVFYKDEKGNTLLHHALREHKGLRNNPNREQLGNFIKLLFEHGISPDEKNNSGENAYEFSGINFDMQTELEFKEWTWKFILWELENIKPFDLMQIKIQDALIEYIKDDVIPTLSATPTLSERLNKLIGDAHDIKNDDRLGEIRYLVDALKSLVKNLDSNAFHERYEIFNNRARRTFSSSLVSKLEKAIPSLSNEQNVKFKSSPLLIVDPYSHSSSETSPADSKTDFSGPAIPIASLMVQPPESKRNLSLSSRPNVQLQSSPPLIIDPDSNSTFKIPPAPPLPPPNLSSHPSGLALESTIPPADSKADSSGPATPAASLTTAQPPESIRYLSMAEQMKILQEKFAPRRPYIESEDNNDVSPSEWPDVDEKSSQISQAVDEKPLPNTQASASTQTSVSTSNSTTSLSTNQSAMFSSSSSESAGVARPFTLSREQTRKNSK